MSISWSRNVDGVFGTHRFDPAITVNELVRRRGWDSRHPQIRLQTATGPAEQDAGLLPVSRPNRRPGQGAPRHWVITELDKC
jgi:hypothetical protein